MDELEQVFERKDSKGTGVVIRRRDFGRAFAGAEYSNYEPFFGFEFVLTPIAVKWVSGGERDKDLAQVQRLIDAFPEEAKAAEIPSHLVALQNVGTLSALLGTTINAGNTKKLCSAALPLNLDWASPEDLVSGANTMAPHQEKAWAVFYETVESL
ncbi:MAG: hypothetical protein GY767_20595 [Shimia sp.]|nr:hypothetical protein [Shimia sp.]MCP4824131.1 hypothetical protein [Shimia sp.]